MYVREREREYKEVVIMQSPAAVMVTTVGMVGGDSSGAEELTPTAGKVSLG